MVEFGGAPNTAPTKRTRVGKIVVDMDPEAPESDAVKAAVSPEFIDRFVNCESFDLLTPEEKTTASKPGLRISVMDSIMTKADGPVGTEFHQLGPFKCSRRIAAMAS